MHVNLTATSAGARSIQANGSSPIAVSVAPGSYSISAWAPGSPNGFYYPVNSSSWTIAPGAVAPQLTVRLADQIVARGTISVPAKAVASTEQIEFLSDRMNATVSGRGLTNGFYLAPGSYDYIATVGGPQTSQGWMSFGSVSVSSTGAFSRSFALTTPSVSFEGSVDLPSLLPLPVPAVASFVNPGGFAFPAPVVSGTYNVTLPVNVTYTPFLNVTAAFPQDNVTVVEALSVPIGESCQVRPVGTICNVNLVGREIDLTLTGRLAVGNSPALVPGALLFEGPSPSVASTRVQTASDGTFSVALSPGTYTVYANSSSGTYALLTTVAVLLGSTGPVTLTLLPAWSVALTALPPPGEAIGAINLTLSSPLGLSFSLTDVVPSAALSIPLPAGTYLASATAPSRPFGVPTVASASVTFNLLTGNVGLTLPMTERYIRAVQISVSSPTNLTQSVNLPPSGGTVALGFTIRNTGNAPVNVTVLGNPSTWNFTISPSNFTLGTGSNNLSSSGSFTVKVPAGTPVNHPPILLVADLAGTTQQVGQSALPAPVSIHPKGGVIVGRSASVDLSVTPSRVTVPLYATNTGNFPEAVAISVSNGATLAQLGWTNQIESSGSTVYGPLTIAPAGNTSVTVVLNATLGAAPPPGSLTVSAEVLNTTGGVATSEVTVSIPVVPISVNGSAITVIGPNVGTPPSTPDWLIPLLAFVPAIAFVVALVVYRWYSTRRWVR